MSTNQKEAVFAAVTALFDIEGVGAVELNKEQRAEVVSVLVDGFLNKRITYSGDLPQAQDLKNYCNGLLSNWLRKDSRLNGGVKYQAKNPGSRTGSTDPQIKAMRALLATRTDAIERAEIQAFIDRRMAEIKPATKVEINVNDLPAELRAKLGV